MNVCRYPPAALLADDARAGAGLVLCLAPLALPDLLPAITVALAAAAAVFALMAVSAAARHVTRIAWDEAGVSLRGPVARSLPWADLTGLRLAYFSTRRDGGNGWMTLTLVGRRRRLRVDSRLPGFRALTAQALQAAERNGAALDDRTRANLAALGIAPAIPTQPPRRR